MASSSELAKKKEHEEAGRRKLEEFRKKRGAKKSVATSRPRTSNSPAAELQASEHTPVPVDSTTSVFSGNSGSDHGFIHNSGSEIDPQEQVTFQIGNHSLPDLLPVLPNQVVTDNHAPDLEYKKDPIYVQNSNHPFAAIDTDIGDKKIEVAISLDRRGGLQDDSNSNFPLNLYGGDKDTSSNVGTKGYFQASTSELDHNQHGSAFKNHLTSDNDERRPSGGVGSLLDFSSQRASKTLTEGLNFGSSGSVNGVLSSPVAETYVRRSRPSFLDSLNIGRDSNASGQSFVEKEKFTTSKLLSGDFVMSSNPAIPAPVEPLPTPVYSNTNNVHFGNGFMEHKMVDNSMESKLEFNSQRQNEDFAALEQHIEDLTQEKFSLQRAMEASKGLAESLAAENSSLTESYNHQASIVSQLKAEIERLQEEIKIRLVELDTIKVEFTNAHLECNAADERAKLLASEVINLEEKALRLRSNELKLERELENKNTEIASHKKKLSNLENERRDFQQTIDALQEEKKLLQSKLRKASTSGISVDLNREHGKKDASTSTNDLRNNSEQASSNTRMHDDTDNLVSLEDIISPTQDVARIIPPDQVQVIQNINSLISEITMEKEEVMQALISEVSTSAKLKEMNKELSHKLEVQTQRLELLTAQSMASDNLPSRQPLGSSRTVRETVTYADEGDEVVERVLGWIMKLFPGGPSKRRTSRL